VVLAALLLLGGCSLLPEEKVKRGEFDALSQRVTTLEGQVTTLQGLHPDLARTVSGGPAVPTALPGDPVPAAAPAPKASGSERAAYQRGQNLLKQKQYDQAAEAFRQMLADYPSGRLAPNAAYWLGECYYAAGRYGEAAAGFQNAADRYPESDKAPDAMMKLSCSYDRLGDNTRAMAVMDVMLTRYPSSNAAKMYYNGEGCFRR
jgi:tol-pal system protein YbgF